MFRPELVAADWWWIESLDLFNRQAVRQLLKLDHGKKEEVVRVPLVLSRLLGPDYDCVCYFAAGKEFRPIQSLPLSSAQHGIPKVWLNRFISVLFLREL
jgi:hypothetical protein